MIIITLFTTVILAIMFVQPLQNVRRNLLSLSKKNTVPIEYSDMSNSSPSIQCHNKEMLENVGKFTETTLSVRSRPLKILAILDELIKWNICLGLINVVLSYGKYVVFYILPFNESWQTSLNLFLFSADFTLNNIVMGFLIKGDKIYEPLTLLYCKCCESFCFYCYHSRIDDTGMRISGGLFHCLQIHACCSWCVEDKEDKLSTRCSDSCTIYSSSINSVIGTYHKNSTIEHVSYE
eukprot:UN34185